MFAWKVTQSKDIRLNSYLPGLNKHKYLGHMLYQQVKVLVYMQRKTGMNEMTVNSSVWMGGITSAIFSGKGEIRQVFVMYLNFLITNAVCNYYKKNFNIEKHTNIVKNQLSKDCCY